MKNIDNLNEKVVIVTGASSGIGKELINLYLNNGYVAYGIGSRDLEGQPYNYIKCDVRNFDECNKVIEQVIKKHGKIDVLINNAGIGISGPIEYTEIADAKNIFDVNFFGAFNFIKAVLPYMREQKKGRIVNTSSMASFVPIPYQAFYSASKSALDILVAGIRSEVMQFNIKITNVHPGDAKTDFTSRRKKTVLDSSNPYAKQCNHAIAQMEKDEQTGMKPIVVAKAIYKTSISKRPKLTYVIGGKYKFFAFALKLLPQRLREWAVRKMYF